MFDVGREIIAEDGSLEIIFVDYARRRSWRSQCHWFVPNSEEKRMTDTELWALLDECSN
jgi:hypothetical protein